MTNPIAFAKKVLQDVELGIINYEEVSRAIALIDNHQSALIDASFTAYYTLDPSSGYARIQSLEKEVRRLQIAAGEIIP